MKPENISQTLKAIALLKHPGFRPIDRLILFGFVSWATSAHASRNAHPGVENLCEVTGHKARAVKYRLRKLESWGLIECTGNREGGAGKAPVYRLCLEHPAYKQFVPKAKKDATKDCTPSYKPACKAIQKTTPTTIPSNRAKQRRYGGGGGFF